MNDIGIPLAFAGRALIFEHEAWWPELTASHPRAAFDLATHRYVSNLFSPLWGVLFDGDKNADS